MSNFTCKKYHLDMPTEAQPGFCGKRQRVSRPGDYCGTCDIGIKAARDTRDQVRSEIDKKRSDEKGEDPMAICDRKCVLCGKDFKGGPTASKCPACKPAKAEKTPTKKKTKKTTKPPAEKQKMIKLLGRPSCEDCKVLGLLVTAGIVTSEKVDAARSLASQR